MFVEIGLQGKGFVAPFAIKVLESRMGLHVSTKIGPDTEKRFIRTQSATTTRRGKVVTNLSAKDLPQ